MSTMSYRYALATPQVVAVMSKYGVCARSDGQLVASANIVLQSTPTFALLPDIMTTEVALDTTVVCYERYLWLQLLMILGPHHGRTLQRPCAQDMQKLRYARTAQLLQRSCLPPRHSKLHDSGWRSYWYRSRRRIHIRREVRRRDFSSAEAHRRWHSQHGQLRPQHQRLPIFHHTGTYAVAGRKAHNLWSR